MKENLLQVFLRITVLDENYEKSEEDYILGCLDPIFISL
jgi:hypothetical protein